MRQTAYESLEEFMTELDSHFGGWSGYVSKFESFPEANRVVELTAFDSLLENEHRPSRQHAEYIAKRRQLGFIHDLRRRVGR